VIDCVVDDLKDKVLAVPEANTPARYWYPAPRRSPVHEEHIEY